MYGYIYKIICDKTNKVYVGQVVAYKGLEQRLKRHIDSAESGCNFKISKAIRKYGKEHFKIVAIDTADSREELNEKEKFWIARLDSRNNGYNMTPGGEGGDTYSKRTEEQMAITKKKLSERMKLNNPNKGQFIGERNSMYGKHHSEEAKAKISKSLLGRKDSEEAKLKKSKAFRGKKKNYIPAVVKLYVIDIQHNNYQRMSAKDVVEKLSLENFKELKQLVDNKIIYNNNYLISKSVSTIPDECKEVELEIGTNSKRTTTEK